MQGSDNEKVIENQEEEIVEADVEAEAENADVLLAEEGVEEETQKEPPTVEEQLEAAKLEAEDYKDRWLRSQAEFANARKRMEKQRTELYSTATADVIKNLLPILDDYGRALENVPEAISEDSWLEGIQLVQRKLIGMLETYNVTPIAAVGEPFDPNVHEAISQEPSDEHESGVVCRELQTGYKIGDRVIRPSLVIVAE